MIVVKIGGGSGIDLGACCRDLSLLRDSGHGIVVVHGGSAAATELGAALGYPPRFITAPSGVQSRYTDERTLEIFTMALAGINARIVTRLQHEGVDAVGLCGADGRVLSGRRKEAVVAVENGRRRVIRDDRSGVVDGVNTRLLRLLLHEGYVPVVSPPALSPDGLINVDADRAAAAAAVALGASTLVLLTNVPGLLRDRDDPSTLVRHLDADEMDAALEMAGGRMRVKMLAAREALQHGVARVIVADGRRQQPITGALGGEGTELVASDQWLAASSAALATSH